MSKLISKIIIDNVASYKEPTEIKDLKKINFFFGSNGTGKSTIGKYLQALKEAEDKENVKEFEQCSIQGYNQDEHEIIVFSQDFIERNFIKAKDIAGIFTLDEINDNIEKQIKNEQEKINKWNEILNKLEEQKIEHEDSRTEIYEGKNGILQKCWDIRKKDFENNFPKLFKILEFKKRETHYNKLILILKNKEEQKIDYEHLKDEYQKLYEKVISKIEQSFNSDMYRKIRRLERQINTKLSLPFTGNKDVDIANMIETLNINKWVEERYIQLDKSTLPQKCPFCQEKTINKDLIQQFDNYFDRTYTEKKEAIKNLNILYNYHTKEFVSHLKSIKLNYPNKSDLNQLINKLEKFFEKQEKIIQDKIDNTNKELSITSLNSCIQDLKRVIITVDSNNENFEKLDEKRQELIQKIWSYMAFHAKEPIEVYKTKKVKIEKKLKQIRNITHYLKNTKIKNSQSLIEAKRKDTANTDTAKDEINEILKSTGFHGFEIDKKDETENNVPRYYLKRHNEEENDVFSTLSEGEKNFIAFLYFYWLCKGTDDQKKKKGKKKIIVIDDPVSSLDSQALFVVTTVIRELIKNEGHSKPQKKELLNKSINQVFVLSHNLYFYNEVSYNNGFRLICQNINHYKISKPSHKSLISKGTEYSKIENDYNLMWRGLFELKEQEGSFNIVIGNLMRRIIQSYLQFTHNHNKERVSYEALTCTTKKMLYDAFSSQINKESHHINPMEELSFQRVSGFNSLDNNTLFEVFEILFKDIGGENHYKIMVNSIN